MHENIGVIDFVSEFEHVEKWTIPWFWQTEETIQKLTSHKRVCWNIIFPNDDIVLIKRDI